MQASSGASCTFIIVRFVNHIGMEEHSENPLGSEGSVHAHPVNEPPMAAAEEVARQIAEELRRLA